MKTCSIDGCNSKHKAMGLCTKHYRRFKRHGDPLYQKREYHGMARSLEYDVWTHMIMRCHNPDDKKYHRYGGRGIIVCDRWRYSFKNFYADMGKRPFLKAQIDRIDNDGNYEPSNLEWTTNEKNCQHTSKTKLSTERAVSIRSQFNNSIITKTKLGAIHNIHPSTVSKIINNKIWKEL